MLLATLLKFKAQVQPFRLVSTPIDLIATAKFRGFHRARLVKQDHDRVPVIDFLLANIFKVHILLESKTWVEAF